MDRAVLYMHRKKKDARVNSFTLFFLRRYELLVYMTGFQPPFSLASFCLAFKSLRFSWKNPFLSCHWISL